VIWKCELMLSLSVSYVALFSNNDAI
jgi:hypothetical protein